MLELHNKRDMTANGNSQFCFTDNTGIFNTGIRCSNAPKLGKMRNEYMDKVQTSSMF